MHVVTSRGRLPCPRTIRAHASSRPQPLIFHECVALRFPEPHGAGSRLCLPDGLLSPVMSMDVSRVSLPEHRLISLEGFWTHSLFSHQIKKALP